MTKDEITEWLKKNGKDRHWLAEQIGSTYGSITQWFSKGFPEWAVRSITLLMNPEPSNTAGLEVEFTAREFERIEQARELTEHPTRAAFYKDAILEFAEQIIQSESNLKSPTPKPAAPTVKTGQTKPTAPSPAGLPENITPLPKQHLDRAAEDASADDSPPAKKVSYGSGNGRRKKT